MRYVLLVIVAVVFLTGIVWWVTFVANALIGGRRRR